MGWSCSVIAGDVMQRMSEKSFAISGSQNIYSYKGSWFMWETSKREYGDGSITESIFKFVEDPRGKDRVSARRIGSFRIDGRTGKIRGGYGLQKLI